MQSAKTQKNLLSVLIFSVLFGLLFQYRILSYLKKLGFNANPIGTKFPIHLDFSSTPIWLLPIYHTIDYLNTVWFTTLLGFLIAGAFITFFSTFIQNNLKGNGIKEILFGTFLGVPNMFCTCCAASTTVGIRKAGAGLGPTLSFFVTAPTLNIVVILLSFNLLPFKFALARLLLGIIASIGITYLVTKISSEKCEINNEINLKEKNQETVTSLLLLWLNNTWKVFIAVIPLLLLGIFLVGILKTLYPMEVLKGALNKGFISTLTAAIIGTILMVPTFTEVILVSELIKLGVPASPLIALLITLPAVSLPSLMVLGKNLKSYKIAVLLGIFITLLGIIGGLIANIIF